MTITVGAVLGTLLGCTLANVTYALWAANDPYRWDKCVDRTLFQAVALGCALLGAWLGGGQ